VRAFWREHEVIPRFTRGAASCWFEPREELAGAADLAAQDTLLSKRPARAVIVRSDLVESALLANVVLRSKTLDLVRQEL
jgi:hypothetical protein